MKNIIGLIFLVIGGYFIEWGYGMLSKELQDDFARRFVKKFGGK